MMPARRYHVGIGSSGLVAWLARLRHFTVYRRIFVSFLLVTSLTVVALTVVLSVAFTRRATRELSRVSERTLQELASLSSELYDDLRHLGSYLMSDREIVNALFSRDVDRLAEFAVNLRLNQVRSVYPMIRFISIYNARTDRYINMEGLTADDERPLIAGLTGRAQGRAVEYVPRRVPTRAEEGGDRLVDVITFVFRPQALSGRVSDSLLLLNVRADYLQDALRARRLGDQREITLLDRDYRVLASTAGTPFLLQRGGAPEVARIVAGGNRSGVFVTTGRGQALVSYAWADEIDWLFVGVQPVAGILGGLEGLRRTLLATAATLLLAGLLFSFFLTGSLYNPLGRLVRRLASKDMPEAAGDEYLFLTRIYNEYRDRMARLEDTFQATRQEARDLQRDSTLRALLDGSAQDPARPARAPADGSSFRLPAREAYRVLRFCVDDGEHPRDDGQARAVLLSALLSDRIPLEKEILVMDGRETAAIVMGGREQVDRDLRLALEEIQIAARRELGVSLSVGIGSPVGEIDRIGESFHRASRNLLYRYVAGPGGILDETWVEPRSRTSTPFPAQAEARLLAALRSADQGAARRALGEIGAELSGGNLVQVRGFVVRLLLDVQQEFEVDDFELLERVASREFLASAISDVRDLCDRVVSEGRARSSRRRAALVQRVREHLDASLADPNLNPRLVADAFRISPGYLGKIFREETGVFLTDYVNSGRIERAAGLLASTGLTTLEISRRVGISNHSYFFTLFKKLKRTTPSGYRRRRSPGPAAE